MTGRSSTGCDDQFAPDPTTEALPACEFEAWIDGFPAYGASTLERVIELCNRTHRQATYYQVNRVRVDKNGVPE